MHLIRVSIGNKESKRLFFVKETGNEENESKNIIFVHAFL